MVHHISFLKLKPGLDSQQVENLIVETRIRLLRIPEVLNLRVGKKIDLKGNPHDLFFSLDAENLLKLRVVQESAVFVQFQHQVVEPNVEKHSSFEYEMEPGKDVTYS